MKQNKSFSQFLSTWVPRAIALMLAMLIFVSIKYLNMADRTVRIPLEVTLPPADLYSAESLVPTYVDVVLSGDDDLVYLIDPASITATADFSSVSSSGITRVPVVLHYNEDAYKDTALTVTAQPEVVRILFEEV